MKNLHKIPKSCDSDQFLLLLSMKNKVLFDLDFNPKIIDTVKKLKIGKQSQSFNLWLDLDKNHLNNEVFNIINNIDINSECVVRSAVEAIVATVNRTSCLFNSPHVWIEIRLIQKNDYFTTTRWHTDSKFFEPLKVYKTVAAIKGASTRFGETRHLELFDELSLLENMEKHGTDRNIQIRKEIDTLIEPYATIDGVTPCSYLASGIDSVIHSEPDMKEDRVFISVIAGTQDVISFLKNRMQEKLSRKARL